MTWVDPFYIIYKVEGMSSKIKEENMRFGVGKKKKKDHVNTLSG